MIRVAISLVLAAGLAVPLAAQDTTKKAAAPPPAPAAPAPPLTVAEAAVARSVTDRVPQDTGIAFPDTVGTLVFFTKISGAPAGAETVVHHVWFHGDAQVADIELHIAGSPWRTWSRKTVPADWKGAWHVEVRDASGAVLKRVDFTVGQ
jgi:Protein of unknown function (DUF2914)